MALMKYVTCMKCNGEGVLVGHLWYTSEQGICLYHFRAREEGEDATLLPWEGCPTCHGVGVLSTYQRAEVWDRVATAGIVLDEELREEGDLDYDALCVG